jgi:hypothetical protein
MLFPIATLENKFENILGTWWEHENPENSKLFRNQLSNHPPQKKLKIKPCINPEPKVLIKVRPIGAQITNSYIN